MFSSWPPIGRRQVRPPHRQPLQRAGVRLPTSVIAAWSFTRHWAYASELAPCAILVVPLIAVPRSPHWLAEEGQIGKALEMLTGVHGPAKAAEGLKPICRLDREGIVQRPSQPALVSLADRWGRRPMRIDGSLAMIVSTRRTGVIVPAMLHPAVGRRGREVDAVSPHHCARPVAVVDEPRADCGAVSGPRCRQDTVCAETAGCCGTQAFGTIASAFEARDCQGYRT